MGRIKIEGNELEVTHVKVYKTGAGDIIGPGVPKITKEQVRKIVTRNAYSYDIEKSCLTVTVWTRRKIFNIFISPNGMNQNNVLADMIHNKLTET